MLYRTTIVAAYLCMCLHPTEAFTTPTTTTAAISRSSSSASSSSSSTATNLFFGDYLPLSIPFFVAKDKWDNARRTKLKEQILSLASETQRGLTATEAQAEDMQHLFSQLEQLNPTVNPLTNTNSNLNGDWSLDYTTSDSILGKGGPPRMGPIVQSIDTTTLSAKNSETLRVANVVNVPRSITAELSPVNGKFTNVQFKKFMVGPVSFNAPDSFRGSLDITYLDDEVRLTRGDKGNIFVLTRM